MLSRRILTAGASAVRTFTSKKQPSGCGKMPSIDPQASFENLELETMGTTWYNVLEPEFKKPYFLKVRTVPAHLILSG